ALLLIVEAEVLRRRGGDRPGYAPRLQVDEDEAIPHREDRPAREGIDGDPGHDASASREVRRSEARVEGEGAHDRVRPRIDEPDRVASGGGGNDGEGVSARGRCAI